MAREPEKCDLLCLAFCRKSKGEGGEETDMGINSQIKGKRLQGWLTLEIFFLTQGSNLGRLQADSLLSEPPGSPGGRRKVEGRREGS